jgi:hypothetical protein
MSRSLYSGWCLGLTLVYVAFAIFIVWQDRNSHGGGWISLDGMISYLITFPVSAFFDALLSFRLDHRRNLDMAFAILGTATCIYFALFGAATLLHTMFSSHAPPSPPRP